MMALFIRAFLTLTYLVLLIPLFWVGCLLLAAARTASSLRRRPAPPRFTALPQRGHRVASIVVLNWNGRQLLEENLPSVVAASRRGAAVHEVLVVDNGSDDGSVEFVKTRFPEVRVLELERNLGFGEGNNAGVRAARHPLVVLLNNDMRVEPDFLEPLLDAFDDDVFAASAQIDFIDAGKAREETGKTASWPEDGWFRFEHQDVTDTDVRRGSVPVSWAGGGSSAFHRERFLYLGGFDPLYSPCYVEDTDLSLQAAQQGWRVLLAPASRVHHHHRASSSRRFSTGALEALILRNQILFAWVGLRDWSLLLAHFALFPLALGRELMRRTVPPWTALPAALARLPRVLQRRWSRPGSRVSDRDVFRLATERFRAHARASSLPHASSIRLRLLMVTAYLPHLGYHAGAGRMFHLVRRLAERHDITVVSFLESEQERERAEPLRQYCRSVELLVRRPDYIRSLYIYEPFDAFYSREMRQAVLRALEAEDFDLIHFEYTQMGQYYLPECPLPQVLTQHEVNFAACAIQARARRSWIQKLSWFYNSLQVMQRETHICRRMDRIVCMTDRDARDLAGLVEPSRLAVVRTGVDLDYFAPQSVPEEPQSLVFVGSFQHHPNVDAMIWFCRQILPRVREQIDSVRLFIVGSGPPAELTGLMEAAPVTVTGYVEDLRPYIAGSALYVVPLRLGVGIRGKILEAWAMERAVIATSLACAGLPAEHGENIWVADTASEFAAGIVSLLRQPSLRRELGRLGRRAAVAHFGWDQAAGQLEDLYLDLLGRPRRMAGSPEAAALDSREARTG